MTEAILVYMIIHLFSDNILPYLFLLVKLNFTGANMLYGIISTMVR